MVYDTELEFAMQHDAGQLSPGSAQLVGMPSCCLCAVMCWSAAATFGQVREGDYG